MASNHDNSADQQPQGFLNNAIVGLLMVFTIPALLVVGATIYVAEQGRVPGGEETVCQRTIDSETAIRLTVYAYQAGLTPYQLQTFEISQDGGQTWREIFEDDVQAARGVSCEDNIRSLADNALLVFNRKSVAFSPDAGVTWNLHNVCDDPRPESGSCEPAPLQIVDVSFDASGNGVVVVQESITDEYGEPLTRDGQPLIAASYNLLTSDGGQTWRLSTTE